MGAQAIRRRNVLRAAGPLLLEGASGGEHVREPGPPTTITASALAHGWNQPLFQQQAFNMVGVFDIDWLTEPRFIRLLDNMAASPGAFGAVRVFGALSSGQKEAVFPTSSGTVWPRTDAPIDLSPTLDALEVLVRRGLVPFLPLTFFPAAVAASPIQPPDDFANWQRLVRAFLDQCVARFGAAAVGQWWLEVWNEPNMPPFWHGDFSRYLDLYRATSEVVTASGHTVRLGGPAIAYMPDEGLVLMERFLLFLHQEPDLQCDFISFHRKGIWVDAEEQPRLERPVEAARRTAETALRINPDHFRGLPIINNEADMKVAFDTPFEPRMTEQFPAWLMAQAIAYDRLDAEFAASSFRFWAASDNANQHLVRAPFDGRRSIMTRLNGPEDLVKVPAFGFYELVRLLRAKHGSTGSGEHVPSGLYHLTTKSQDAMAAVFAFYPDRPESREVEFVLRDVPWQRINIARFCIDAGRSNAFTASGRRMPAEGIDMETAVRIRRAQELSVLEPIRHNAEIANGEIRSTFRMDGFSVVLIWATPFLPQQPAAPRWLEAQPEGNNVVLRWTPNSEPWFYSYELVRLDPKPVNVAPVPLRSAMWVDAPGAGHHAYEVRAISASGVRSESIKSPTVQVAP